MSTYDTAIPNTPQYLQAQAMAKKAYEMAVAHIAQQRSSTLRGAGYLDKGNDNQLTVDPNNLFGGIQSMLRQQANENTATRYDYAGRGLQGGIRNAAGTALQLQHGGESAAFGTSLARALGGYATQGEDAKQQYDSALWTAQQAALQDALMNQMFNQALLPAQAARPRARPRALRRGWLRPRSRCPASAARTGGRSRIVSDRLGRPA